MPAFSQALPGNHNSEPAFKSSQRAAPEPVSQTASSTVAEPGRVDLPIPVTRTSTAVRRVQIEGTGALLLGVAGRFGPTLGSDFGVAAQAELGFRAGYFGMAVSAGVDGSGVEKEFPLLVHLRVYEAPLFIGVFAGGAIGKQQTLWWDYVVYGNTYEAKERIMRLRVGVELGVDLDRITLRLNATLTPDAGRSSPDHGVDLMETQQLGITGLVGLHF